MARHLERGVGVVVLDMKGDELLARRLHAEAERHDRLFYRWTPEGGDHWNPLARGNRSELKDKLIATEEFSERHYQAMYERYLLNVFRALESRPEKRDLQTVVRLLDPQRSGDGAARTRKAPYDDEIRRVVAAAHQAARTLLLGQRHTWT